MRNVVQALFNDPRRHLVELIRSPGSKLSRVRAAFRRPVGPANFESCSALNREDGVTLAIRFDGQTAAVPIDSDAIDQLRTELTYAEAMLLHRNNQRR